MSREVVLICCLALASAGTLGTDYSPATAVSYSSIRIGASSFDQNPSVGYAISSSPTYNSQERYKIDEESITNNAHNAPIYTEAIFPRYIPSRSRVLNIARPLPDRNMPQSPSPEFASVPSVLKTEGLSAYASPNYGSEMYSAPEAATGLSKTSLGLSAYASSIDTYATEKTPAVSSIASASSIRFQPAKSALVYSESVPSIIGFGGISAYVPSNKTPKDQAIDYPETSVSHVSVSSSGTNYSW